jgi:hypothetical protein
MISQLTSASVKNRTAVPFPWQKFEDFTEDLTEDFLQILLWNYNYITLALGTRKIRYLEKSVPNFC